MDLFDVVSGSDLDETIPHTSKGPILASALERLPQAEASAPTVMVGDRKFDVEGAARNTMPCIGVTWGYAPEGELEGQGAAAVVSSAEELRQQIAEQVTAQLSTPRTRQSAESSVQQMSS